MGRKWERDKQISIRTKSGVIMGRIRKPPSTSSSVVDFSPTLSDIFRDSISKHRSCWLHVVSHHYRCKKKITWEKVREIKRNFSRAAPCYSLKFPNSELPLELHSDSEKSNELDNHGVNTSKERFEMDTGTFECYMESIWKNFSEEKRTTFTCLDSLWFSLYRESSSKSKVLSWIKQKSIFSKKYVFVPIVCWGHWNLLILVNFDEGSDSESRTPCMLLFDSLENAEPKRLEPEIRKFILDIYKTEGRTEDKKAVSKIPLLVPKVPQQRDDKECGNFVLYFIKLFMENAPDNFSIVNGYPYFMSKSWFEIEDFDVFWESLDKELPQTKAGNRATRISRRKKTSEGEVISIDE